MGATRRSERKIVLVVRRTRLAELIARFNTLDQARFYVEHLGADFSDYVREDERYQAAMGEAQQILSELARLQIVDRAFLPNFLFGPDDTVVALGQDGLVANTVKYLAGQPVLGVNPDPERWDGVLLPFRVAELSNVVPQVFAGQRPLRGVTMARARLNNGQVLHAVNDLFIGVRNHGSARYRIALGKQEEQQSSSGVIVSTGLGSTGWLKSLIAGATAIARGFAPGEPPPLPETSFPWDAEHLCFTVREPFPSRNSAATLVFGKVTAREPLRLVSQMPEDGVIFSDGIQNDFVEFHSGAQVEISVAERRGALVV